MIIKTNEIYEFMGCEISSFEKKDDNKNIIYGKDGKPEIQEFSKVRFADVKTGAAYEFLGVKNITEEIKRNGCIDGLNRHDEGYILIDLDDYNGKIGKARFAGFEHLKRG